MDTADSVSSIHNANALVHMILRVKLVISCLSELHLSSHHIAVVR